MEIILLIIAGTVSGCDGWKSLKDFGEAKLDWLRKFLPYKDGIPVHDTLARVMRKIETKSFQACFMKWVQSVSEATSGKDTEDTRFYIASIEPNAKKTLTAVRQHWGIEHGLHWTLDMTFREDESRIRTEAAPENFAIMRHMALNLIKNDTSRKASVKRKRFMAA